MPLPPALVKKAREFRGSPAPARAAATVVLLDPETLHVYVLRRASTMVFGGMHAFPGGRVDPDDRPETVRGDWADRLGVPDEQARAVVGAAARELFEEAGVLLAGPLDEPERTVGDVSSADWEADRAAVAARELSMTDLLARRGLRLRDDLLLPWSRWITPEFEPKRFDTWFFVALLPQAQTARDVSGEADTTTWISPAAANGLAMLPPTRVTLDELSPYRRIDDLVAASGQRNAAVPIMPQVELTGDGGAVVRIQVQPNRPVM
ncbi:NUDIX hydrolase [Nucisporomicrobium flavum]|uniref:NUDIX hydrolase n=1 Tax=Nucisporomicrobium flavum TaxID=2785915 RepID=UPI003C2C29EB